jgi:L-malate glycosyltransferase
LHLQNVDFAGPIAHGRIGAYYERADIFINASRLDNMPVSILEAFACGTPVVTTAAGGIRYLVEHERTGLMCEPGEWQSLAESVLRLLREGALASRIAANAYEESKKYRWESVRGEWLAAYRSAFSQS